MAADRTSRIGHPERGEYVSLLAIVLSLAGCGADCPTTFVLTLTDETGSKGLLVTRVMEPDGSVWFSGTEPVETTEPTQADIVRACGDPLDDDVPGWIAEAWLDTDGSVNPESCKLPGLPDGCRPDPGEPQDRVEFTLKERGRTEVEVVLGES